ncbi:hypothetical protein [endosymbiont GvMRE of Glomus versiforme]|nr:hypothetical protein [endosymbiont GvMRE of Glomus versiforme]
MNTEIKKKKKTSAEKKNPVSHQAWLNYKKQRNQKAYRERKKEENE